MARFELSRDHAHGWVAMSTANGHDVFRLPAELSGAEALARAEDELGIGGVRLFDAPEPRRVPGYPVLPTFFPQPLGLLNTSIITAPGEYRMVPVSLLEARQLLADAVSACQYGHDSQEDQLHGDYCRQPGGFDSAVGHESTAAIMTTLLGMVVPVNRQQFAQAAGQHALVFKLRGRAPEGAVLTVEEISAIGYDWYLLSRTDTVAA